jgi:SAM-dependent methyltransferase
MSVFDWIRRELDPQPCTSAAFIYDDMASQSGRSLPIVYEPFDVGLRHHWRDRGALFDFLFATDAAGKRVLDFGPGDGWPALILAPFVAEVVGVDASRRRVEVCRANAVRLGIGNASFVHAQAGAALHFADEGFDVVVAASSVEQAPDPHAALAELRRVLRPGGRLRLRYEALNRYRGGREQELWLHPIDERCCRLILYDRQPDGERAVQYGLTYALPAAAAARLLTGPGEGLAFGDLTVAALARGRAYLIDARVCATTHPSGPTWIRWLAELGFRKAIASHDGAEAAGALFDCLAPAERPADLPALDAYLAPIIRTVVALPAPAELDPPITALK